MAPQRLQGNPRIPEGINASTAHPLVEFLQLAVALVVIVIVVAASLSLTAQWLAPHVPFSWEARLASGFVPAEPCPQCATDGNMARDFHDAEQALQALGTHLQRQTQPTAGIEYRIHLLQDPTPNAMATLGGHIFVTTALLSRVRSENALAMVLAHEMAHVNARDPLTALCRGLLVGLAASLTGNSDSANTLIGNSGLLTVLAFNRDMERDADRHALTTVNALYGHIRGSEDFFLDILAKEGSHAQWRVFFETHPGLEERIAAIRSNQRPDEAESLKALDPRLRKLQTHITLSTAPGGH